MSPSFAPFPSIVSSRGGAWKFFAGLAVALSFAGGLAAQTTLYWDNNSVAAGSGGPSPSGSWDTGNSAGARKWSTNAAGTSSSVGWSPNGIAVFSAGTDATGGYTVTVSGIQSVSSIFVQEGNPTITSGTLNFSTAAATFDVAAGATATLGSVLTGASTSFTKSNAGTLNLSGSSTMSGAIAVTGGTLNLSGNNLLTTHTAAVSVSSGATFALAASAGNSNTIGALTGAGTVSIGSGSTLTVNATAATTFDGQLTGTGLFEKSGSATLSFSNASNTGAFNFAGTVQLTATSTTDTLEFNGGSSANALSINTLKLTGGTLMLNAATINVTTLNITGNTILDFGTGGGSTLNAANISIAAGATLTVKNWSSEVDFLFANSSFQTGTGTSAVLNTVGNAPENQIVFSGDPLSSDGSHTAWVDNLQGYTNFEIRPIPEPSTYGLAMLTSCLGYLAWRRRRAAAMSARKF